ncbi:MAG: DNA repair exonuclease [Firmicutes bacterium]|nr:DNA repair exonuclease [Bacillota bacterium]
MEVSFRFLHLADLHLDTSFYGEKPELRRLLQQEARMCLERAVDLALAKKVQALLIAGDLFDQDLLSFATEKKLLVEFQRLRAGGVKVFYAPGNHDPFNGTSGIGRLSWPDNVYIYKKAMPEMVYARDREGRPVAAVTGAGHESRQEGKNLVALFPPSAEALPRVALLHALVLGHEGSEQHSRYAPCSRDDLRGKGYHYWALGHVHSFGQVLEEPAAYYPGNTQGRNPTETGPKGCLLVEIDTKGRVQVNFERLSRLCWERIFLQNLEQVSTLEQLQHLIVSSIQKVISQQPPGLVLLPRVYLLGTCPLYRELKSEDNLLFLQESLLEEMALPWLEIKAERLFPPLDLEKYRQGPHLLAEVLKLLARAEKDDELLLSLAPRLLAAVEAGYVGTSREEKLLYLRRLLQDMDKEIALRLIKDA